jgi:hypothetical protein
MGRRAPSKKTSAALSWEEDALVLRLEGAFSTEELRRVLASALLVLDEAARDRLFARLGPEASGVLAQALRPRAKAARRASPTPTRGKLHQEWDRAWREWNEVVGQTGDEQSKYVLQDEDWEPPYLDTGSIAEDLDAIASRMRPLVPEVIVARTAPEFSFARAIEALDRDLYTGLPEWIEPGGGESCALGPEATSCLLAWEWTIAQREGRDAPRFLDALRDLEDRLANVVLDDEAVETFVLALPEESQRAVLESMVRQRDSERWESAFDAAWGCWPAILRELSRRFRPDLHAETSRANIPKDWTLALPLLQGAEKRKAHAEVAALADEAMRSRLRLGEDERWDPRRGLLLRARNRTIDPEGQDAALAKLLQHWRKSAEAQGQADVAAALALQIAALRSADDGDAMLEAFAAIPEAHRTVREALFADWRALIVERTFGSWGTDARVVCGGWVAALVDAARVGPEGAAAFAAAVRAALDEGRASPAPRPSPISGFSPSIADHRASPVYALALLTLDLASTAQGIEKLAPKLFEVLAAAAGADDARDRVKATRRAFCARLGGRSLLAEVLAFWRDSGVRFVPDPETLWSDYNACADWFAAVRELAPATAAELLARWAAAHRRKRNLWRDLALRGVALPEGVHTPKGVHRR